MDFLFYIKNNSSNILIQYGIDAKNIDTHFVDNSFVLVPHDLNLNEYKILFEKYSKYNIIFLFDFTYESYTHFEYSNLFWQCVTEYMVSYDRIIMLYNNMYDIGLNSYKYLNNTIHTISFPRWYYETAMYLDRPAEDRYDYGNYDVSCFNRMGRPHKLNTLKYLDKNNINCFATHVYQESGKFDSPIIHKLDDDSIVDLVGELELKYYYYGKVNICTETLYDSNIYNGFTNQLALTEKIFRNLWYKIPFTVVGNKYTLNTLHNIGFKTFNNIVDESYDSSDDSVRYIQSVDSALILSKKWKSSELDDILSFNREFFENRKNAIIHFENNVLLNLEKFKNK